jgi:hypothetical protein
MQATTGFHDGVSNPILHEADGVLHNPVAFHPPNGVFNADSDRRNRVPGSNRAKIYGSGLSLIFQTFTVKLARTSPKRMRGSSGAIQYHSFTY